MKLFEGIRRALGREPTGSPRPVADPPDRPGDDQAGVHVQLARALVRAGRLSEAAEHLVAALRLRPDDHDALVALGRAATTARDYPLALKAFRLAVQQAEADANTTLALARTCRAMGLFAEARDAVASRTTPSGTATTERDLAAESALATIATGDFDAGNAVLVALLAEDDRPYRILDFTQFLCQQGLFGPAEALLECNREILNRHLNNTTEFDKYLHAVRRARDCFAADAARVEATPGASLLVAPPLQPGAVRWVKTLQDCLRPHDEPVRFDTEPGPEASASVVPDDLDGLLSDEIEFLYGRCRFGTPQPWRHGHRLYVLPGARLSIAPDRLPNVVLESGFHIAERMNLIEDINFLHRAVLTERRDSIPAAFILPSWDRNHYHTLCCSVGTLSVYRDLGLEVPIVFPEALSENQRAVLQAAGLPPERAVVAASLADTVIETAYVPESMPYHWSRGLVEFHRGIARNLTAAGGSGSGPTPEFLYLSRVGMARRPLANETEVEELARSFGFEVIHPEELSYRDQVTIFAGARAIMSPHGAGFVNFIYSTPGTTIIELTARETAEPGFCRRAHIAGHRYFPLLGEFERPAGSAASNSAIPWRIDTGRLARLLERVLP